MHPRSRLKQQKRTDFSSRSRLKKPQKGKRRFSLRSLFSNPKKKLIYVGIIIFVILIIIPPATYLYFANDLKSKDSVMNRQETGLTLLDRNGQSFYTYDLAKTIS